MALLAMAVWDTPENKRHELTKFTIGYLYKTVNKEKHQVIIVNNGSTDEKTLNLFVSMRRDNSVIWNQENVGQARALNQAWQLRKPGEHVARCDSDIAIAEPGWLDKLEACVGRDMTRRDALPGLIAAVTGHDKKSIALKRSLQEELDFPQLGIIGLKRKDLWERPNHLDKPWRSELRMLPHEPGQDWLVAERVGVCEDDPDVEPGDILGSVIGTCQLISSRLFDRIGYLWNNRWLWGHEDSLYAARAKKAGFWSGFYPSIGLEHTDPCDTPYQSWKERNGMSQQAAFERFKREYLIGKRNIYHGPDDPAE